MPFPKSYHTHAISPTNRSASAAMTATATMTARCQNGMRLVLVSSMDIHFLGGGTGPAFLSAGMPPCSCNRSVRLSSAVVFGISLAVFCVAAFMDSLLDPVPCRLVYLRFCSFRSSCIVFRKIWYASFRCWRCLTAKRAPPAVIYEARMVEPHFFGTFLRVPS